MCVLYDLVDAKFYSPLLKLEQHLLDRWVIELPCTAEPMNKSITVIVLQYRTILKKFSNRNEVDSTYLSKEPSSILSGTYLPSSFSSFFSLSKQCSWVTDKLPRRPGSGRYVGSVTQLGIGEAEACWGAAIAIIEFDGEIGKGSGGD